MTQSVQPEGSIGAVRISQTSSAPQTAHGAVFFTAILAIIKSLDSLNSYLKTLSISVLNTDLQADQDYANQLGGISLQPLPANVDPQSAQYLNIQSANEAATFKQQLIQARLKAHQNSETSHLNAASSTSTNANNLSGVISSIFALVNQVFGSVMQMNR